jgi:hypothetical protein
MLHCDDVNTGYFACSSGAFQIAPQIDELPGLFQNEQCTLYWFCKHTSFRRSTTTANFHTNTQIEKFTRSASYRYECSFIRRVGQFTLDAVLTRWRHARSTRFPYFTMLFRFGEGRWFHLVSQACSIADVFVSLSHDGFDFR